MNDKEIKAEVWEWLRQTNPDFYDLVAVIDRETISRMLDKTITLCMQEKLKIEGEK